MEKSGLCKDWGVMFFYNNIGRGNYLNFALLLKGEEFIYDSLEIRELWGGRFGIIKLNCVQECVAFARHKRLL